MSSDGRKFPITASNKIEGDFLIQTYKHLQWGDKKNWLRIYIDFVTSNHTPILFEKKLKNGKPYWQEITNVSRKQKILANKNIIVCWCGNHLSTSDNKDKRKGG